jgi:hypothetical protein
MPKPEPITACCGHYAGVNTNPDSITAKNARDRLCPDCYIKVSETIKLLTDAAREEHVESIYFIKGDIEEVRKNFPGLIEEYSGCLDNPVSLTAIGWHYVIDLLALFCGTIQNDPKTKSVLVKQLDSIFAQIEDRLPMVCKYAKSGGHFIPSFGLEIIEFPIKHYKN